MKQVIFEEVVKKVISEWDDKIRKNRDNYNPSELTLSTGLSGIVLMLTELDYEGSSTNYRQKIDEYIEYMVDKLSVYGLITGSLYSGASGIALSVLQFYQENDKYKNLIGSLNKYIDHFVRNRIKNFNTTTISPPDYDLIEGMSGILAYLLLIEDNDYIEVKMLIVDFLSNLIIKDEMLSSFYIKSENLMSDAERKMYPLGCLNMGLAHGLAGVGSVLAYAYSKGYKTQSSLLALKNIISLYEKFEIKKDKQLIWKDGIIIDELRDKKIFYEPNFIRDAWCYGSPGISLLYLYTGLALNDEYLILKSKNILEKSVKRKLGLDSYMLCHGYSGIIEICLLFKRLLGTKIFDFYIKEFQNNAKTILEQYDDRYGSGFLEGISGCLMTLLDSECSKNSTYWRYSLFLFDDSLTGGNS